jgi:hypothetical protein
MKTIYTAFVQISTCIKPNDRLAILIMLLVISLQAQAQVGIGTATPDGSAQLDVSSTKKGILIPRMSSAEREAISTPAKGLLVFQTNETAGFYYYNGSAWISIRGKSAGNPGPVLTNGTGGGQVYLTAPTSPYAPQAPQNVTGDVTINAQGITSIAPGAVSTNKLANGAVTPEKLAATGTADGTTYLRGDNTWANPQQIVTTSVFHGAANSFRSSSNSYVFAFPTTSITLDESKQVTASAVLVLGYTPNRGYSSNSVGIDVCYQLGRTGPITGFNGDQYLEHRFVPEKRNYAATGSTVLPTGTYKIGVCVRNSSDEDITIYDYVNGWVMVH